MINLLDNKIIIENNSIEYWIDSLETDDYVFKISGWAIVVDIPSWQLEVLFDFNGSLYNFSCKPFHVQRDDVTAINGKGAINYNASGFYIEIPRQNIGQDCYNISLRFKNRISSETILSYPFLCLRIQ